LFLLVNIYFIQVKNNNEKNYNYNLDVNSKTITNNEYDITYFDPPYNNRQYSSNYHPLNFIAKYDDSILPYGKTGLLENSNKSNYSISKKGKTTLYKYEYKKFKSKSKQDNETVYKYLYLCKVDKKGEYSSNIVEL